MKKRVFAVLFVAVTALFLLPATALGMNTPVPILVNIANPAPITGKQGVELIPQTIRLDLGGGGQFNTKISDDCTSWFKNLPRGLTVTCTAVDPLGYSIRFIYCTISGTPEVASSDVISIIVPSGAISGATADVTVTSNPKSKWAIEADKSETPTAEVTTLSKTAAVQPEVSFTLTNAPALEGEWKVYGAETGGAEVPGVTASASGATLTLKHDADLPAAAYYVAVTQSNKAESDRLALTVLAYEPPAPDVPTPPYTPIYPTRPVDDAPVPTNGTVYNQGGTIWLTGMGLDANDLFITDTLSFGDDYDAMMKLADKDDVFRIYDISLGSGKKSTGYAMHLHFDLANQYAGQTFTLVHEKADGGYEYFYATADANGDLTFGPLYELSPFMLVKGALMQAPAHEVADIPQTADGATMAGWAMLVMAGIAGCAVLVKRERRA